MIINLEAKLAYLAMTKCGSTAFENALKHEANIIFSGSSTVSHMTARRYHDLIVPYLGSVGIEGIETTAVIRYPLSWLESWWRYRSEDRFATEPTYTAEMSFDRFVNLYIDRDDAFSDFWSQAQFLSAEDGKLLVDHIFRYEELQRLRAFWEARLGYTLFIERYNVSPSRTAEIAPATVWRLEDSHPRDYEIWHNGTIGHLAAA